MNEFYKGKKVFITGHTGFKGALLAKILLMSGAKVYGYGLEPDTKPNLYSILNLPKLLESSIIKDIREMQVLTQAIKTAEPEIVFHLAAQATVRRGYEDPAYTFTTNSGGTANVLEACQRTPSVKAVVVITTDKVYEESKNQKAHTEDSELGGNDPYASSKVCAELIARSFRESFDGPFIATARAGNVIGGGDWARDRLIPDFVRATYENNTHIEIRMPNAIRPWQFVLEPIRGYLMLGKKLILEGKSYAEAWNFGPRQEDCVSVKEVIKLAIKVSNKGRMEEYNQQSSKKEASYLKIHSKKAKELLSWTPLCNVQDTIEQTMLWYDAYYTGADMKNKTEKMIEEYWRLSDG